MNTDKAKEILKRQEEERKRKLASAVTEDFLARQRARKQIERGWQINMNFLSGNQFCDLSERGEIEEEDKDFYWQSRRCFNHIAPTIDTRLARLSKVRPSLSVRPFSDAEDDVKTARLSSSIIRSVSERVDLDGVVSRATLWSETCGTAFYKIVWDYSAGRILGTDGEGGPIREGDVNIIPLSPFEIYPDSLTAESLEEIKSLIHAKAVPVSEIKEKFGVSLAGRPVKEFSLAPLITSSGWKRPADGDAKQVLEDREIVIERYIRPSKEAPDGKLEIVAGGVLLYEGPLPYCNGERGERTFPFVRQTCISLPGAFFGTSVIDRMIPLQRAYNAVRNRKHEFLNRLTAGVIAVEDGSVDAEELAEDGLCPGKVLVYRQGSKEPHFLDCGALPSEFEKEEERLTNEFILFSGMSEISRSSQNHVNVTSATGLQLLLDQDRDRLHNTELNVERAIRETGKQILHLYKQFASAGRLLRMTGSDGETELYYFDASQIGADDVRFEFGNERTPEEEKEEFVKLLSSGILKDADGKLSEQIKQKALEVLGFASLGSPQDISALHIRKAEKENIALCERDVEADDYDDHAVHITEHTRALLSGAEEREEVKARLMRHIASHRQKGERI